jgi:hypothetical protein
MHPLTHPFPRNKNHNFSTTKDDTVLEPIIPSVEIPIMMSV